MTAIAFEYPDEIRALRDGLAAFVKKEVIARHERHAQLLDDGRRRFADDGRFVPEVVELIREVRMASARVGYYGMSAPIEFGGLELGHLAYFAAWEQVAHLCASKY